MARPRKAPSDEAVKISIPRWACDLVDGHVQRRAAAALFAIGESTGLTVRELAAARNAYLAGLINDTLGYDARHPVSVQVSAPVHGDAPEIRAAAKWLGEAEAALNESAPPPIKAALEANRMMHRLREEAEGAGMEEEASILGEAGN